MQINTILKSFLAAGVLSFGVGAADAATLTYSFDASSATVSTRGGLSLGLGVAAFNVTGGNKTLSATSGTLAKTADGLGMNLNTLLVPHPDRVDSVGAGSGREAVTFSFSQAVTLTKIVFSEITPGVDKGFLIFRNGTASNATDAFGLVASFAPTGYSSALLAIGAKAGSGFYISSITVETVGDIQPVPVPAAGLLLGSLALVPMLRRKRRA